MTPATLPTRDGWPRAAARLALCLLVAAASASLPAGAQAAAPANDDFADAQVVRVGDRVTGSTAEATLEVGEPAPTSELLTRSVWYRLQTSTPQDVGRRRLA